MLKTENGRVVICQYVMELKTPTIHGNSSMVGVICNAKSGDTKIDRSPKDKKVEKKAELIQETDKKKPGGKADSLTSGKNVDAAKETDKKKTGGKADSLTSDKNVDVAKVTNNKTPGGKADSLTSAKNVVVAEVTNKKKTGGKADSLTSGKNINGPEKENALPDDGSYA
nr:hypothetical protein CFP56_70442 [Quercus suber]